MPSGAAPDRWLVLEVERPVDETSTGLFVHTLASLSGRGVEEREGLLIAYFDRLDGSLEPFLQATSARLSAMAGGLPVKVRHRWKAHEDWIELWRKGLKPRRITPRLVVSPTWAAPSLAPGDLLISIDPGIAFGSAEHATTRGSLRLLDRFVEAGQRIADVGSGSGILSIAAALMGAESVVAFEIDPWACAATRENALANGVDDRIEVVEASVGPDSLSTLQPFHGIVSNIDAAALIPRLQAFRRAAHPGGWLILGGVRLEEAESVSGAAEGVGLRLAVEDVEENWWTAAFSG